METLQPASRRVPLILVADPDHDTRQLYREALRSMPFEIEDAADGREALIKAIEGQPTLVITESRLPFIDGYTLCNLLRRDAATRDAGILMLTADALPAMLQRAVAFGADSVLLKPCPAETLVREVARVERLAKSRQVAEPSNQPSELPDRSGARRHPSRTKAHQRFETTSPPRTPPQLICPSCERPLVYKRSYVGGVSDRHPEQWDYYDCSGSCGSFQYRQRTRKVRPAG
jgi:two-component system response regulator ResD